MLIAFKPASGVGVSLTVRLREVRDPSGHLRGVRAGAAVQRAAERLAADGEVEARDVGMQPGATPRTTALGIGNDDGTAVLPTPENHSQEVRPAIRPTTPDARAHGPGGPESSPVGSHQSSAYAGSGASTASPAGRAGSVSGRMSMRQPVSFAASLAFCPSRPMASDSW